MQDRFAALDLSQAELSPALRKALASAKQELDAIRFGMCEAGQSGEIRRIFSQLEALIHDERRQAS